MKKKTLLLIIVGAMIFTSGCSLIEHKVSEVPEDGAYLLFALNIHDWAFLDRSAEAVEYVLDVHEEYEVPIEIFITDAVLQKYLDEAPELIEKLRYSDYATVSYHNRPPYPYYNNFDWYGLDELTSEEKYALYYEYETHTIDLETGEPSEEPGGFGYFEEVFGYAPRIVGISDRLTAGVELSDVYRDLGVQMGVQHGIDIDLGDQRDGLLLRPEHSDLKIYEYALMGMTPAEVYQARLDEVADIEMPFIGVKYHENNFYTSENPWRLVFYEDKARQVSLEPPFDLSRAGDESILLTEDDQQTHWQWYESVVKYAAESEQLIPLSTDDVLQLLNE